MTRCQQSSTAKPWGQFGQLARDDNLYLQVRYEFEGLNRFAVWALRSRV